MYQRLLFNLLVSWLARVLSNAATSKGEAANLATIAADGSLYSDVTSHLAMRQQVMRTERLARPHFSFIQHAASSIHKSEAWYTCGQEGEACDSCASGHVRFGDPETARWAYRSQTASDFGDVHCSVAFFSSQDVAPGVLKSCECQGTRPPSSQLMVLDVCTGERRPGDPRPGPNIPQLHAEKQTMAWEDAAAAQSPITSCKELPAWPAYSGTSANGNLKDAVHTFCKAGLGDQVEFFVDPEFADTFAALQDEDGWIPRAYVTYVSLHSDEDKIGQEVDLLVQSVHHFSKAPIVVTNFGQRVPSAWTRSRFPNMVLMHARPVVPGKSFNFNKLRAMIFTKVHTGILVDADQWVNSGMDSIFERTDQEVTPDYPYPIMPVHWLARDPESNDGYPYTFQFAGDGAPKRSMRWGHAHPTWNHHASSFLAEWSTYVLKPDLPATPPWIRAQEWEDEDLLNVGLWAVNATKQWCKFDIPGYEDYQKYMSQTEQFNICPDTKWYPKGIAFLFYSAHAAKDPLKTRDCLYDLFGENADQRHRILYDGKWFNSGKELKKYDPTLKCMA